MITIPPATLRACRPAFRKLTPGRSTHGPPVEVLGGPDGLHVRLATGDAAAEFTTPGVQPAGGLVLPLDAFLSFDGSHSVTLKPVGRGRMEASWEEAGAPKSQTFDAPSRRPEFPGLGCPTAENPPGLIKALADAAGVAARGAARFAVHRVLLRGGAGEVVATDARQLLIQGGFEFPWPGGVLVT